MLVPDRRRVGEALKPSANQRAPGGLMSRLLIKLGTPSLTTKSAAYNFHSPNRLTRTFPSTSSVHTAVLPSEEQGALRSPERTPGRSRISSSGTTGRPWVW